ncbi:glycerophosphodiester phosphodiesterase [Paenibacillus agricola]|uniref:Glycerophosphodiester phosphodiesterase n=1 Tax=Paenibacillus agricola TaxID=2716264 RepID=A0ABX0JDU1_9BACL|nr:glycerophosphodiester phosphodiesterase family protein [Paenibacillus agricola]NHN34103.1 glycerophosphodiester phosphodiesterase [Paenibacillus agricola]
MIKIVAHRGWSGKAPENTLAAIELALAESAIDMIEFDVHLSKDGVPVVIHDHTLERTTNGKGRVNQHTFDELRQLDAGSWFAPEFKGETIPSLEEVLKLAKGRCKLAVELKTKANNYEGIEQKVIQKVHQYGMGDQVVLSSFDHDSMKQANEVDSSIATSLIFFGKPTLIWEQLQYTGAISFSINHSFSSPAFINEMLDKGIDVGIWTVDDPETLQKIVLAHPNVRITTNHPDRLLTVIKK